MTESSVLEKPMNFDSTTDGVIRQKGEHVATDVPCTEANECFPQTDLSHQRPHSHDIKSSQHFDLELFAYDQVPK